MRGRAQQDRMHSVGLGRGPGPPGSRGGGGQARRRSPVHSLEFCGEGRGLAWDLGCPDNLCIVLWPICSPEDPLELHCPGCVWAGGGRRPEILHCVPLCSVSRGPEAAAQDPTPPLGLPPPH